MYIILFLFISKAGSRNTAIFNFLILFCTKCFILILHFKMSKRNIGTYKETCSFFPLQKHYNYRKKKTRKKFSQKKNKIHVSCVTETCKFMFLPYCKTKNVCSQKHKNLCFPAYKFTKICISCYIKQQKTMFPPDKNTKFMFSTLQIKNKCVFPT